MMHLNIKAFHPINRKNLLGELCHYCTRLLKNSPISLIENMPLDFLKNL